MENFRLLSVVHVFLIKDNRILLLRRFQTGVKMETTAFRQDAWRAAKK